MARPWTLAAALALSLLLVPPGRAWYKPAAAPSAHLVGRAAGLLSGLRGSPYARRSEPPVGEGPPGRAGTAPELRPSLRSPSCERLPEGRATFQCKADVFLSLRAADCRGA
ncbi:neuropeptide B isoform X2 [Desmodus rotundus]|uniref:neuropeptide B isoform X2 n=1 Tax=Desmodus rotundus TaxID=9430 RepID=UPI002380CA89|nr:neuropeptide B isoform X2 [Desmodus rotundus]